MPGEPGLPEYRVPLTLDEDEDSDVESVSSDWSEDQKKVILRVESARNVVVYSVMFVRASVLENHEMFFNDLPDIFNK